jgi:hypothetical protein
MTKCSHDFCKNEVTDGSPYCDKCIKLPTELCNFCNTENYDCSYDAKHTLLIDIIAELFVCLPLAGLITVGILICNWIGSFIRQSVTGQTPTMLSGEGILALLFTVYILLFLWVRIGSTKLKWST